MISVTRAKSAQDIATIHELFVEYGASLGFKLCFQNFEEELAGLPGEYGPPHGCLLLARDRKAIVGCIAVRPISPGICEMKRLYVRPEFRGRGAGRLLAEAIIDISKKIGYTSMRLDTVPGMEAAIGLYFALGFKKIPPYRENPIDGALYLELNLTGTDG